jgi:chloride channel 7
MMAGFSRMTISLVVILMELTENTQFLLAIMLAVMCAKWTADAFGHALYDRMMELKSIAYLEPKPPRYTAGMSVNDVMENDVVCLNEAENLERIVEVLTSNEHNGFPVVVTKGPQRTKTFRGVITRKQLLILLATHKYHQKNGNLSTLPPVLEYEQYVILMNRKWHFDAIRDLPPAESLKDFVLDLEPYMDKSSPVVLEKSSFLDAYKVFQQSGLRHLPVLDEDFQVVGIITRHDLLVEKDALRYAEISTSLL